MSAEVDNPKRAQELMDTQLETNWAALLDGLAAQLNPLHGGIFRLCPADYYWTAHQSEWATDVTFKRADYLERLMPRLVRHGMLNHSSEDVMRFLGGKVCRSGRLPTSFAGELETDFKRRAEGERVKFRMNGNSANFYDKAYTVLGNVLRAAETTINNVAGISCFRPAEGRLGRDRRTRRN